MLEKWGMYGNAERRTQAWRQQVDPPGEARTDVWMMLEFSKRFACARCGREEDPGLKAEAFADDTLPDVIAEAAKLGYTPESTLSRCFSPGRRTGSSPGPMRWPRGTATRRARHSARTGSSRRRCSRSTGSSRVNYQHDLAPFDVYYGDTVRGCAGGGAGRRQVAGTKWRFSEGNDRT